MFPGKVPGSLAFLVQIGISAAPDTPGLGMSQIWDTTRLGGVKKPWNCYFINLIRYDDAVLIFISEMRENHNFHLSR